VSKKHVNQATKGRTNAWGVKNFLKGKGGGEVNFGKINVSSDALQRVKKKGK